MGVVADLEEDEGRPLIGRKALDVAHEHAQVGAPVDLRRQPFGGRRGVVEPTSSRRARTTDRQRLRATV